jgi:SAM-dependent MidA family methyltransferase
MGDGRTLPDALRKRLQEGDLSFRDFVEMALYDPDFGYYTRPESPVGKAADFVTSPSLSPVFAFALGRLVREFMSRRGDVTSPIVDIGCGDGSLVRALREEVPEAKVVGVDRGEAIPEASVAISNELFDAQPFARLVQRGPELRELTVAEREGELDWGERPAGEEYVAYFADRGVWLDDGQFADVSLDWAPLYAEICRAVPRGLIVTFDYGYPQKLLLRTRLRRWGTAAAYAGQRVSRDLLANPGRQDLTAHINFSDLIATGESHGFTTLFFDRQAKFLLALGATEHELFKPVLSEAEGPVTDLSEGALELLDRRDEARRLVLPDGIGEDIRVLVQGRDVPLEGWSFQRRLW